MGRPKQPERVYACTLCKYSTHRRGHFNAHVAGHTGRPFRCGECSSTFKRKAHLQQHQLRHTKERPHKCSFLGCGKAFASSWALSEHQNTHDDSALYPYRCDHADCGKTFASKGNLRQHMTIHNSERRHICETCQRSFKLRHHLRRHALSHQPPDIRCRDADCKAMFATTADMEKHFVLHTGEKPYACSLCTCTFAQRAGRRDHIERYHTQEGAQRGKKQETRVAKALAAAGISFKREHRVDFSCFGATFAREDFVSDHAPGGIISIEVDENQHSGQLACDLRRTADIWTAQTLGGNTLPKLLIRYNPNLYRVDGRRQHVRKQDREARLVAFLRSVNFTQAPAIQVQYMYFDVDKGRLAFFADKEIKVWDTMPCFPSYSCICRDPIV